MRSGSFGKVARIGLLVIVAGLIVWVGLGFLANCTGNREVKPPAVGKAQYAFTIKSTHDVIYSNNYDMEGTVYILHGYFTRIDKSYKYHKADLRLDTYYFGEITVARRATS